MPLIISDDFSTPAAYDHLHTHYPMIKKFAAELPLPELRDYPSATTPGYHLLMATLLRAGVPTLLIRLVSAAFGLAVVLVISEATAVWASGLFPLLCGLLLLSSAHVLASSIWLTTDNLALVASLIAIQIGMRTTSSANETPYIKGKRSANPSLANSLKLG